MAVDEALPTQVATDQKSAAKSVSGIAAFGAVAGMGALAASSCCVLPLVLGSLGTGVGVFATLEARAPLRVTFLLLGALAVAVGWWLYASRRQTACVSEGTCEVSRRPRAAVALLTLATVFVTVASMWSYVEPALLSMLRDHLT